MPVTGKPQNKGSETPTAPAPKEKTKILLDKIEEVKDIVHDDISLLINNLEKAETIRDKSENLKQNAGKFKKLSNDLKKKMWWKNAKLMIIMGVIVIIIAGVIVAVILL